MKLSILFLPILSVLLLTACQPQDTLIEGTGPTDQVGITDVQMQGDLTSVGTTKKRVADMKEKYGDPKQATLRTPDYKAHGKIYIQYDKKEDQTYAWVEAQALDKPEAGKEYVVWLVDNKQPEEVKQTMNIGKLLVEDDGTSVLYYEFPDKGNHYSYLKTVVSLETAGESKGENQVMEANFSPKLN